LGPPFKLLPNCDQQVARSQQEGRAGKVVSIGYDEAIEPLTLGLCQQPMALHTRLF